MHRLNGRMWRLERQLQIEAAAASECSHCHGLKFVRVVFDDAEPTACPHCGNPGVREVICPYVDGAEAAPVGAAA